MKINVIQVKRTMLQLLVIYVVALIGVFVFQRNFLYRPDQLYVSPETLQTGVSFKEMPVTTADGLALKGWYTPATTKSLTVVYLHGNADSLRSTAFIAAPYVSKGYGFLLVEYRGYSGFSGKPTEDGLYADARAFLNKLKLSGIQENNIVLMGYSLGTGVATQMASEFKVGGLMLLAPYTSMPQMAQKLFPIFPAKFLTLDRFDNLHKISHLHMPLLIANGGLDKVVPPDHGRQVFAQANEPKQFYFDPEGSHVDLFEGELYAVSLKWLEELPLKTAQK